MSSFCRFALILVFLCALYLPAQAEVKVATIFDDHMVLQQGRPVPVWGTAGPGEKVAVTFAGQTIRAVADEKGNWSVRLKAMKASTKPRTMTITGTYTLINTLVPPANASGIPSTPNTVNTNTLTFTDVLVGEVWICSGQSNMEWPLALAVNGDAELVAADIPQIRMYTVTKNPMPIPQAECTGSWVVSAPDTASNFSAVGFFFARNLYQTLKVPVGMIHASWGGTPAEPWTPLAALKTIPSLAQPVANFEKNYQNYLDNKKQIDEKRAGELAKYNEKRQEWYAKLDETDPGYKEKWMDPAFAPQGWKTVALPVGSKDNPFAQAFSSIWFRKTVEIPQAWVGKELVLRMGAIDEVDDTFVNGQKVGRTWFEVPNFWLVQRVYAVPAALVTSTKVALTMRMLNLAGPAGPFGPANAMSLSLKDDVKAPVVSLTGEWQYNEAMPISPRDAPPFAVTALPGTNPWEPSTLYNGMIAPLVPYAIRGAVWYQGESNAGNPMGYRELFPAMITAWRQAWGEGDFPFAFVQLANFQAVQTAPIEKGSWAELREAQTMTLRLPNTGMAVAIDIGEANDIHPRNKQDVGKRLALPMLAKIYGKKLEYSGPMYKKMTVEGNAIRITFDHAGGLLARGDKVTGFAIAGEDKVFHFAEAKVDGETVIVSSPRVEKPVAVRYAWAMNPVCNLYNAAGLPASPFRTDEWKPEEVKVDNTK